MHHGIDEEARKKLHARISEIIEKFGGTVVQPASVMLFYSKVRLDPT
jgi:hypothetical protein